MSTPGEVLTPDHRRLEKMLEALKKKPAAAAFREVADHLTAHITVEEQRFYPAVRASRTEDILLEGLEEHLSLKRLLADLLELEIDDPRFEAKLHVLAEQAEHHHKEEEEHLFPKLAKMFDGEKLAAMGEELERSLRELDAAHIRSTVLQQTDEAAPLQKPSTSKKTAQRMLARDV